MNLKVDWRSPVGKLLPDLFIDQCDPLQRQAQVSDNRKARNYSPNTQ